MAPSEVVARQLEHRQILILSRLSRLRSNSFGNDLAGLEFRQALILCRISCLDQSVDTLNCEAVRAQDSGVDVGEAVSSRYGEEEVSEKIGGDIVKTTWNGVPPTGNGMSRELMGEDKHRRHGYGNHESAVEERLTRILTESGASFVFKRVPDDYYGRSFEERRDLLGAASVDYLCKSIVMVNTQAHESVKDCRERNNSKYYVVVVQYTARLNAEKLRHFVYTLNNGKIPKKRFNLRLAPEEESCRLTGFEHNAVTPFGMLTDIPVILSDAVVKLKPEFFWLGGGEVDLKLGIDTNDFNRLINPFVVDCIY